MKKHILVIGAGKIFNSAEFSHLNSIKKIRLECGEVMVHVHDKYIKHVSNFDYLFYVENLEKCLSQNKFDLAIICTPSYTHTQYLQLLDKYSYNLKNILVEKPICTQRDDLQTLKALSMFSNKNISVFCNHSWILNAKLNFPELLQVSKLKPYRIICEYYGGFLNIGCHLLSLISEILRDKDYEVDILRRKNFYRQTDDRNYDFIIKRADCDLYFLAHNEANYQVTKLIIYHEKGVFEVSDYGKAFRKYSLRNGLDCTEIGLDYEVVVDMQTSLDLFYKAILFPNSIVDENVLNQMLIHNSWGIYEELFYLKEFCDAN